MIYKSNYNDWLVAQRSDFSYFYIEEKFYSLRLLDCVVIELVPSLSHVVGSTVLVEWGGE